MSGRKPKVVFMFRGNRTQLVDDARAGRAPDEFLYGFPHLDRGKFDVEFVEDAPPYRVRDRAWWPLETWFGRRFGVGFNMHGYLKNRRALQAADVIVTTVDSLALPVIWQKSRGNLRAKIVYITQGLYRIAARGRGSAMGERIRRRVGRWLRSTDCVVALGQGDADSLVASYGDQADLRPVFIPFGADARFWTPAPGRAAGAAPRGPVLSVGSDVFRDYPTLLKAIGDRPLRIVTRLPVPRELLKPNVVVDGDVDWIGLRGLYHDARYVVNPVQNQLTNSGLSATVQSFACGKAAVVTQSDGMWDRDRLRHLETCYLVRPGDVEHMAEALHHLDASPGDVAAMGGNARKLIEDEYSSAMFGRRLQTCVERVLEAGG